MPLSEKPKKAREKSHSVNSKNELGQENPEKPKIPSHHHKLQQIKEAKDKAQLHLAEIIAQKTRFDWQEEPVDNWAGYSQNDLLELTQKLAILLGITDQQAQLLEILFTDYKKPEEQVLLAFITRTSDRDGNIYRCKLVFNRSRKLFDEFVAQNKALEKTKAQEETAKKQSNSELKKTEKLKITLESPLEYFIWLIGEELCHAKLYFKAKTNQRDSMILLRFLGILEKKNRHSQIDYEKSYQEVIVARNCLKLLKKLYPSRAELYEEVYQISLKTGRRPFPSIAKIKDKLFV